ncbi:MAG: ArsR/SmtB family transcription factor [Pyrinomonadaceae bacterium]
MKIKTLPKDALELVAERFKVLSEPLRLEILNSLQSGGKSVNELAGLVNSSQPNVSKHLKYMQKAGVLNREQNGNTVYYTIADESIFTLCEVVCGSLETHLSDRAEMFR